MDQVPESSEKPVSQALLEPSREAGLGAEFGGGMVVPATPRAKTSLRLRYEAESEVIRKKIGDLEAIRGQLGLSQRKIAQLLLVDPSAWTRWTKTGEKAPPHVYRMLQWYLALQEKYPALDVNFWLNTVTRGNDVSNGETKALLKEIAILKARIAVLESANESGASLSAPTARASAAVSATSVESARPVTKSRVDSEEQGLLPRIMFFVMIGLAIAALVYGLFV